MASYEDLINSSYYDYLSGEVPPEKSHLGTLLPYGIVTCLGALGNIFFVLVVFIDRRLSVQRTNILLILMAFGNIGYLISQYILQYYAWMRPHAFKSETLCELQFACPAFTSAVCVFSLTACSIERYLGVVKFPLSGGSRKPWVFTLSASVICIILALGIGSHAWYWATLYFGFCMPVNIFGPSGYKWSYLACFFATYLFPFVIVSFCYLSIIIRIVQSTSQHRCQPGVRRSHATRKNGILVLVAITLSFAILWLPYHVQRLLLAYDYNKAIQSDTISQLAMYSAIANSVIDPGLIFMLSSDHRRAVVEHCVKLFCAGNGHRGHIRLSTVRSTMCTAPSGIVSVKKPAINGTTAV